MRQKTTKKRLLFWISVRSPDMKEGNYYKCNDAYPPDIEVVRGTSSMWASASSFT